MPDINSLGLVDEAFPPEDIGNLPEFGGYDPLPQPGFHTMQLPADLSDVFDVEQTTDQGQRLQAKFEEGKMLRVVESNTKFRARVSNKSRTLTMRNGESIKISDMGSLLQALGYAGDALTTNKAYAEALTKFGGAKFDGDVDWATTCKGDKPIRDIEGKEVAGSKGCNTVYQTYLPKKARTDGKPVKLIPQDENGNYTERFACTCGGVLRAFGNLRGFRAG